MLYRRHIRAGKKRGLCVGKTKRGKGTKIMVIADRSGLAVAMHVASASPHEVKLAQATVERRFVEEVPERLIGDKAYDSDPLDESLSKQGTQLIAPHKDNRRKPPTQDGRPLRRYSRPWKIERLNAWLQNFRRIAVRYEYHAQNFLTFVQVGCIVILLRNYL
jgi:transposase